jgi:hypothetical protein
VLGATKTGDIFTTRGNDLPPLKRSRYLTCSLDLGPDREAEFLPENSHYTRTILRDEVRPSGSGVITKDIALSVTGSKPG